MIIRKYLRVIFFVLSMGINFNFSSAVFAQNTPVVEKPIEVILGIDKITKLDFSPNPQIQVGNESILRITMIPQKREITFTGLKPGKTSVTLRNNVGDVKGKFLVTVTANDQSRIVKELKDFLGDVEGLEIGIKGETVYIGGNIIVPNDIGRVATVMNQEKFGDVLFLVELSPQTERLVARKMQEEIQKSQLPDVTVRVVNHTYWLEGIVNSEGKKRQAEDIAKAFYPDKIASLAERTRQVVQAVKPAIQNFIQVNEKSQPPPLDKLIKITAQFVELTKDYSKTFGFKWTPLLSNGSGEINIGKTGSGGVTTRSEGTLSGTISNLFPKLNSAKQAGYARVVQSGVVVVKDKKDGLISKNETRRFSLGAGEFAQAQSADAQFRVEVRPEVLQDEKVNLALNITVSTNIGANPPATQGNNIKTELIVKSKDSAVVGGIVINKSTTDYDKLPPDEVENASPLFNFVRGKAFSNTKSQFVVFVTPEIVESATSGTDDIKRKFRRRRR
ncbi:MAG: pilus assembly protein N-terminal domain-containing protein [Bacteriovoracaceae bacterium]|nr:pilus assembly protein N-terminal domain-containing protein [Bacteriovoracaceae bacterium]